MTRAPTIQNTPNRQKVPHFKYFNEIGAENIKRTLKLHETLIQIADPLDLALVGKISLVYNQDAHDNVDAKIATKRKHNAKQN
jgi:hypothetical protein